MNKKYIKDTVSKNISDASQNGISSNTNLAHSLLNVKPNGKKDYKPTCIRTQQKLLS
jgi:hypothetical protein